jgi:UDP-glucose 4-epimerase
MRIIITGNRGHNVFGIDNYLFSSKDNMDEFWDHENFNFMLEDIKNVWSYPHLFKDTDMIVHLAASKIPRFGKTLQCMQNNILGLHAVLKHSKDIPIIIASSSDVYGKQTQIPFNEDQDLTYGSPEHRRWVYGLSKLIDENFVVGFHEEYNKDYNIARFFNVYGENCALDWTGGAVPQIIGKILKDKTVEIHGDGKQTRCFSHVSDIVSGLVEMIEGDIWNTTFNLGNDSIISINDLVNTIYNLLNIPENNRKIKYIPYKEFFGSYQDVLVRQPDLTLIKNLLGWEPKVDLETGLKRTIEWQKGRMCL